MRLAQQLLRERAQASAQVEDLQHKLHTAEHRATAVHVVRESLQVGASARMAGGRGLGKTNRSPWPT